MSAMQKLREFDLDRINMANITFDLITDDPKNDETVVYLVEAGPNEEKPPDSSSWGLSISVSRC